MIRQICKKYCGLNENDIEKIVEVSKSLSIISDFYESDVFIDVLSKNVNEAVVVEHVAPQGKKSLYKKSVIAKQALKENEPGVLNVLKTGVAINDMKALTQENKFVKQRIRPIINDNRVIGVIIVETDISDEIKNDMKLEKIDSKSPIRTQEFLTLLKKNKVIANNFDDAILIFDNDGILSIANDKAIDIYKDLGCSKITEGIFYDNLSLDNSKFSDIINNSSDNKFISEVKVGNSEYKIISAGIELQDVKLMVVIRDITDIKKKEKEIELKNIAIREANHRIKNNLQTVAAILRKQSRFCQIDDQKFYLQESINRILTIATTHDFLSKAINDKIEIGKAIEKLIENFKYNSDMKSVSIYVNSGKIHITGERATALLLVINELVQNCYDHAFNGRDSGIISILIEDDDKCITIQVIDNGIGFNNAIKNGTSLGLSLVEGYVYQVLQGDITMNSNSNGTNVKISFEKN